MKRLSVRGVDLHVLVRGTGMPLVLVHGFPLDHSMWGAQIERFASQAQVIAPDLRGFGSSGVTAGTVTMEQMADDLASILDQLAVSEPVVLCGLSMGGYAAFQFARKYPQRLRALVLSNTRSAADTPENRQLRLKMVEQVLEARPGPSCRRGYATAIFHRRNFSAVARSGRIRPRADSAHAGRGNRGRAAGSGRAARCDRIALAVVDVPTLVVAGARTT